MTRARLLPRLLVLLLLALAVSPVTAPFSTCALEDLLSGSHSDAAAIVHVKTPTDKSTPGLPGGVALAVRGAVLLAAATLVDPPAIACPHHVPLRI